MSIEECKFVTLVVWGMQLMGLVMVAVVPGMGVEVVRKVKGLKDPLISTQN